MNKLRSQIFTMSLKDHLFISAQKILPQALLSRLAGKLANCEQPTVKNFLIKLALKRFNINLDEALFSDINDYKSFNAFFTRELKADARSIDHDNRVIISPCDGMLTQSGKIENQTLIQAKGKSYTLNTLLGEPAPTNFSDFSVIYLSPRDYHRVHMPIDGKLTKMTYIPGKLFSVNTITTEYIDNLFALNERLVCYFDTHIGEVAVIFVGAMLVAGIETVWHHQVAPNYTQTPQRWDYSNHDITFKKGAEIGRFNFGSTIICLFPDNKVEQIQKSQAIQLGNKLADIL